MKNNCGIVAFDKLVGRLNGKANKISIDTLAKLAQDNGFILYPLRVSREELEQVSVPFIAYYRSHFESVSNQKELDRLLKRVVSESYTILSSDLVAHALIREQEARGILGSKSWFSKFISKPFRTLERTFVPENPITRTIINAALGAIPVAGPALATGFGALSSSKGSDPMNVLTGAVAGYGMGSLGAGVKGAVTNASGTGLASSFTSGMTDYFNTGIIPTMQSSSGASLFNKVSNLGSSFSAGNSTLSPYSSGYKISSSLSPSAAYSLPSNSSALLRSGSSLFGGSSANAASTASGFLGKSSKLALGLMGASALFPDAKYKKPEEIIDLQNKLLSGQSITELGEQGQKFYGDILSAQFDVNDPLFQGLTQNIDEEYQKSKQELAKTYQGYGGINSSDYMKAQAELDNNYNKIRFNTLANLKIAAAEQATGIEKTTLEALLGVTGLDAWQAAQEYGVEASTVNSIRSIFGMGGLAILLKQYGITA